MLPALAVEPLAEVALAVKQADADQGNVQVRGALDVIAGQHAQAAGVDGDGFVQAELGREIRDRPRPQNAGVGGAPGAVRLQVFALPPVVVIDAAVQHQLARAALHFRQRHLAEQGQGIVIELPPAHRLQFAEQGDGIVIPAPPQIARERPQALLCGRDEAIERAGLADHGRHLHGGGDQHARILLAELAHGGGLQHQHALQRAAVNQGNAQERLVGILAGFAKVLETGMLVDLLDRHRTHLLGDQADQALVQAQAQGADGLGAEPDRRGQHQIGAIGFEQVGRAHLGLEAPGNQGGNLHEDLSRFAAPLRQTAYFLKR